MFFIVFCIPGYDHAERALFHQREDQAVHDITRKLRRLKHVAKKMIHEIFGGQIIRAGVNDFDIVRPVKVLKEAEQFFLRTVRRNETAYFQ